MDDKHKKKYFYGAIIALVVIIIFLLLRRRKSTSPDTNLDLTLQQVNFGLGDIVIPGLYIPNRNPAQINISFWRPAEVIYAEDDCNCQSCNCNGMKQNEYSTEQALLYAYVNDARKQALQYVEGVRGVISDLYTAAYNSPYRW